MKIESTEFTAADLDFYRDELADHERKHLANRLRAASARLTELGARVEAVEPGAGQDWNGREVLAHIAVLSKFYGMLTYKVGSGQMTELDLLASVNLRDVLGEQLSREEPSRLVEMACADHRRTIDYLLGADTAAMRRECVIDNGRAVMRAEDFAREPLIAHLELHLDQLQEAVAG